MMIRLISLMWLALWASMSNAAPETYRLNPAQSTVGFIYAIEGNRTRGQMPIHTADMMIDLDNLPASRVNVALNASKARAGFIIATDAMRGPKVLDTANHPLITFQSTKIQGSLRGAVITGDLTIRGVTRPVSMRAVLYRQDGAALTDRNQLTVQLTGEVSRKAFGATGFPGLVDDMIGLQIIARIEK